MKRYFYLIVALCFVLSSNKMIAQSTEVIGDQSGTWNDTIMLCGDVTVSEMETLAVNPGTVVISKKNFRITVFGNIEAVGTEEAPIVFTVADTTGFADYEQFRGGWGGIEVSGKTASGKFEYCDFSYGKTPLGGSGAALHFLYVQDAEVSNCVFHDNIFRFRGGGICAEHSNIKVTDCEAYNNKGYGSNGSYTYGGGFYFINCDVEIENMVSHDNSIPAGYGGGCSFDSCNVVLNNAIFYNNYATNGGGLGLQRSKHRDVKMSNVLAYNNMVVHYGGGMAMATASPELNNITLVNNICGGGGGAGMQMAFESDPKINNSIIYGNHAIFLDLAGDTTEYYYGSQVWLWGDGNWPEFNNGTIQYGLDSIYHNTSYEEEGHYVDMEKFDPLFLDAENHDYRLSSESPCIDKGLENIEGLFIPETDLNGQVRVFNNRIDMGCYEWNNIGLNEMISNVCELKVTPNPLNSNSVCNINLEKTQKATLRLISLDGKEIFKKDCGMLPAGENQISLGAMIEHIVKTNKMYLLIIDTQENKYCNKVIY